MYNPYGLAPGQLVTCITEFYGRLTVVYLVELLPDGAIVRYLHNGHLAKVQGYFQARVYPLDTVAMGYKTLRRLYRTNSFAAAALTPGPRTYDCLGVPVTLGDIVLYAGRSVSTFNYRHIGLYPALVEQAPSDEHAMLLTDLSTGRTLPTMEPCEIALYNTRYRGMPGTLTRPLLLGKAHQR